MKRFKTIILSFFCLSAFILVGVALAQSEEELEEEKEEETISMTRIQYQNFVSEKTRENITRQRSGLSPEVIPTYEEWFSEQTEEKEDSRVYNRAEDRLDLKSKEKVMGR
ncbi:MAG: hypothetical protein FJZ11_03725 [Candidatus Omnitrophica bacterium]|nr:hypothetical protein [Candidatus Omnitrophota bacterium]